jgi:type II secretory ATPase GspE/PulE/Tfp pilus assembly ATPase PilB-like protein
MRPFYTPPRPASLAAMSPRSGPLHIRGVRSAEVTLPAARVIGRLLVESGAVRPAELEEALAEQQRTRERLGEILVRRGTPDEAIARALAEQLRIPFAEPPLAAGEDALAVVERAVAVRLRVLPLAAPGRCLRVATADPLDLSALDDLQFRTGRRVQPVVTTAAAIDEALLRVYGAAAFETLISRLPPALEVQPRKHEPAAAVALRRALEAPPIVALVDLILGRAIAAGASDVHVEPGSDGVRVRARVDGLLEELLQLPAHAAAAVVSRLKVMADLDISIKRRPQDGRGAVRAGGRELALRVSTLPTEYGEKVVLRLLDPGATTRTLADLGLAGADRARLDTVLARSHGAVLVTGPTGSGKTTTLYAALAGVDRRRRNVITLEDPVEYRLPGITQVHVRPRAGLTFATALRAVLRQDPDVVLVGEMRDRETVEVGMAAAMTGHLVLSSLHTTDAAGAVARLTEMGAAPYLVAGALAAVLAQRLVRRACRHCGPGTPPDTCAHPAPGRLGVFELLVVDDAIRSLILRRRSAVAIRKRALAAGMTPLAADAAAKLRAGLLSPLDVAPLLAGTGISLELEIG